MKFTLKNLFCYIFGFSLFCIIFQRPLRSINIEWGNLSEFAEGFCFIWYWALWLCYNENLFDWDFSHGGLEILGILTGIITSVFTFLYLIFMFAHVMAFGKIEFRPMKLIP